MLDFDKGAEVHLDYEAKIAPYDASDDDEALNWESCIPGNPNILSVEVAMAEALTPTTVPRVHYYK
jgi:hypothetical protein